MSAAHTPGPWILGAITRPHEAITGVYISVPYKGVEGGRIAECLGNCLVASDANVLANARLIAAAPALLAALIDARDVIANEWGESAEMLKPYDTAIAQARGGQ